MPWNPELWRRGPWSSVDGAASAAGFGTILVAELVLSHCGGSNLPSDGYLISRDGTPAWNDTASSNRNWEPPAEGRIQLLAELGHGKKCLCAKDCAQRARKTPGLRVAGFRALPGYAKPRARTSAPSPWR